MARLFCKYTYVMSNNNNKWNAKRWLHAAKSLWLHL